MSSKKRSESTLVITYFYGVQGCCPAEWADDKVHALNESKKNIILLTSMLSQKSSDSNVKHYRIPSLSIADLQHEINETKQLGRKVPYFKVLMFLPFVLTLGLLLDLLQKVVTAGNGGGKWSWAFPAAIVALYLSIRYRTKLIFTTGGPASAHLAGVFVRALTGKRLVCELQDPLTGKDIGRNSRSALLLGWVESLMIKNANKVVYVTKQAAEYVKNRYPKGRANIVGVYPGSWPFKQIKNDESSVSSSALTIIHLGTLYSTRNLYTLIEAIDELIDSGAIASNEIEILNLGEIYGEIKDHHLQRSYVRQESIKPREEAVILASKYKVSLLVQHSDDRSNATIPYKTYDYLNIGNPILALTNNEELYDLLAINGHLPVAVDDVSAIKVALLGLLNNYPEFKRKVKPLAIDILKQTSLMLE